MDDPTQVLKIYGVIDVTAMAATPTEKQWQDLNNQARAKPLIQSILAYLRASQNEWSAHKRAQGTQAMKLTMFTFEIHQDDKTKLQARLNTIATAESVTGSVLQKLQGSLQYEFRQAAVNLGYTAAQANKLTVTILNKPGLFDRDSAMQAAQEYLAANDAAWHVAEEILNVATKI